MPKCDQCENSAYVQIGGGYLCVDHYWKLTQAMQLNQNNLANMLNYLRTASLMSMGFLPPNYPNPIPTQSPFQGDSVTLNNFNIDRSTIGAINTGYVMKLDVEVEALKEKQPELTSMLKEFTQALLKDTSIPDPTRNQILEYISFLGEQVATPKEQQNTNIAKDVIDNAHKVITAIPGLTLIWSGIQPLIRATLGL